MTKALSTLIKLHQQFLDEKRRELVFFEEAREKQKQIITNSNRQIEMEKRVAEQSPDKSYTFFNFLEMEKKKQFEASKNINALNKEIEKVSESISEAFTDLKKYEILKDIKDEEALKEEMKRLQINLDEIGAVSHQRKQDTNA